MKLVCRQCGNSKLIYITGARRHYSQHDAICSKCHKPLDPLDWDLNPGEPDDNKNTIFPPVEISTEETNKPE